MQGHGYPVPVPGAVMTLPGTRYLTLGTGKIDLSIRKERGCQRLQPPVEHPRGIRYQVYSAGILLR